MGDNFNPFLKRDWLRWAKGKPDWNENATRPKIDRSGDPLGLKWVYSKPEDPEEDQLSGSDGFLIFLVVIAIVVLPNLVK